MTAQVKKKRRSTFRVFRSLYMLGAAAFLLILGVAIIVPGGVILASNGIDSTSVAETIASVPAVLSTTTQNKVFEPVSNSSLGFSSDPADIFGGGVTPPNDEDIYEPPMEYLGGTCISGFVIDRYHQPTGTGWTVKITHEDGDSKTTTVDEDGEFKFEGLDGGVWTVELEIPDGWREFTPASFQVTLSGDEDDVECAEVRFKVKALPCLIVKKLDAGGYVDFYDLIGIAGWEMTASNDDITLTAVTDGKGEAFFYDLNPGTWVISEEEKIGWQPARGYGYEKTIVLDSPIDPGVCDELVFVNEQIYGGCIEVQKVDSIGVPLQDWKMTIIRDDGTQPSVSTYTDAYGFATFKDLSLGSWTVEEEVYDWWRPVDTSVKKVNLDKPGFCEPVVFSNEPLGCIDGYKINHYEQGLENWKITVRNDATGDEFTEETDETGYFQFENLPMGTWTVSEEMQTGWVPVTPSEFVVDVTEQYECEHVRFKNKTEFACVDVYKLDYYDGSGIAGWEINVKPAYGGDDITGETDGTGWVRFNGLTPGDYVVSEVVQDGWDAVGPEEYDITLYNTGICDVVVFENIQEHQKPPPPPPDDDPCIVYTVKGNEKLYNIVNQYGADLRRVMRMNGLSNPREIHEGMTLLVCYP